MLHFFDGAMGTQLQARGLAAGEIPELLCLSNPDEIREIHAAYVASGSEAVTTNTFGANPFKLKDSGYEEVHLVKTDDGMFISPKEARLITLKGSALLYGKK